MSSDDLIVTNPRQLSFIKRYLPEQYQNAMQDITEGKAIVTQEVPGCKAF